MGYSCSVKASNTLEEINKLPEFTASSNECKYFIDIGKENEDSSITGSVYILLGEKTPRGFEACKKLGSFKIDRMGNVIRFPGLSKKIWEKCKLNGQLEYEKQFDQPLFTACW